MIALVRLLRAISIAASMGAISAYGSLPAAQPKSQLVIGVPAAAKPLDLGPDIAAFYRDRGYRPLWIRGSVIRPEAFRFVALLPPHAQLHAALQAARGGDRHALTRADLLLTKAYADHVSAIRRSPDRNRMHYVDDELKPEDQPLRALLDELASASSLGDHLELAGRRNPAFDGLRRGLQLYRTRWSALPQFTIGATSDQRAALRRRLGLAASQDNQLIERIREFQRVHGLDTTGLADAQTLAALNRGAAHYERLIETNIERARAIPARAQGRYVLVDTASARLWLIEDGRVRGSMRVVVGKQSMQTPVMAGLMRHVVLNPYWNLPPDLIRQRARNAVLRGAGAIVNEQLQILSDWSEDARVLAPGRVDWAAVAAGRANVNMRQSPGSHNVMGAIKFMFPNELGIYLHDTPFREHFSRSDRRISSGCVRVEDAARLARWIFRGNPPTPTGRPEEEVELPQPVPVYITYLTALPTRDGVVFLRDRYGRDQLRTG